MMSSQKISLSDAGKVIEKHLMDDNKGHDDNNTLITNHTNGSTKMSLSYVDGILRGVNSIHHQQEEERGCSPLLFETPTETDHPLSNNTSISNTGITGITGNTGNTSNTSCVQYCCPPDMCLLKDCLNNIGGVVTIMALIIEVNSITEVTIKNGPMIGTVVNMATISIADPSMSQFIITLWRDCAVWVERLTVGDIVILTGIKVKVTKATVVTGNSINNSGVLNLHQPNKLPAKLCGRVPEESFVSFLKWSKREYYHLFNNEQPKSQRLVKYIKSCDIQTTDIIIHFRGKILSFISDNVIIVSDEPSIELLVLLVGRDSKRWKQRLRKGVGLVWEMTHLQVLPESSQSGLISLQMMSSSHFHCIEQDGCLATDILQQWSTDVVIKYTDINTIIDNIQSGRYQLKATMVTMRIIVDNSIMNIDANKLSSVIQHMVYSGCGQCTALLKNKVCSICGSDKQGYYYRSVMMHLVDGNHDNTSYHGNGIDTIANHAAIARMLEGCDVYPSLIVTTPTQLLLTKMADRLLSIMSGYGVWTVNINIAKDENSFINTFNCSLVDWTIVS